MILDETYDIARIEERLGQLRAPRELFLRAIYAFHLLERLKAREIDFIFKGGTSLLMVMDEPKRFSTDVDIIVGKEITDRWPEFLAAITADSRFKTFEDDNDRSVAHPGIQHYALFFDDPDATKNVKEYPLVLDILHVNDLSGYRTQQKPLRHSWIVTDGQDAKVKVPTYEWMLGDKLSAFAPRTTGVDPMPRPLEDGKEKSRDTSHLQSAKHLHDCGELALLVQDLQAVDDSLRYHIEQQKVLREQEFTREEVLQDIISAAVDVILGSESEVITAIARGIRSIRDHLIYQGEKLRHQQRLAAITAAMAHRLLENEFTPLPAYDSTKIKTELAASIRSLRKSHREACFYLQDAVKA